MRLMLHWIVCACFFVVLSPILLIEWLFELRRRAKERQKDEARKFGESSEDDL